MNTNLKISNVTKIYPGCVANNNGNASILQLPWWKPINVLPTTVAFIKLSSLINKYFLNASF